MGYVNLPCIGAEVHLPFGGVKRSGNGQPSAAGLVDSVTHKTSFTVNHDRADHDGPGHECEVRCERLKIRVPATCAVGFLALRRHTECAYYVACTLRAFAGRHGQAMSLLSEQGKNFAKRWQSQWHPNT